MKKILLILAIAFASCTASLPRHQMLSGKYVITSCSKKNGLATVTLFGVKGKFVFPASDSIAVNKEITVFTILKQPQ